jgi:hypothetical protein
MKCHFQVLFQTFIEQNSFFHSNNFEVKWAVHKKGDIKKGALAQHESKTLVILLKGTFRIDFSDTTSALLKNEGDYVAYDAGQVNHTGVALAESRLIVIRWPSKPQATS